jgi:peroxiredoxin (alkyl hydroperoxide reductase subunit C)
MSDTVVTRVGEKAPLFKVSGFDAVNERFDTYSLEDYTGKYILLFFYPGDFTYVCPTELVSLASLKGKFDSLATQVFVVSTDSKFSHKNWNEIELSKAVDGNYPYPMLSDTMGQIGAPYGVFKEADGVDLRGVVLIDKKGVVQIISVNAPQIGRNPKELVRLVMAQKEHDDTGGRVIPACWVPGEETIDPSYNNSGNMWNNYKNILENEKK